MTQPSSAALTIAVRAWAVPQLPQLDAITERTLELPDLLLVFDTETRLDPGQALTFGVARVYRRRVALVADDLRRWECIGEYLIAGDVLTAAEQAELERYVAARPRVTYFGPAWDETVREFRRMPVALPIAEDGVPQQVVRQGGLGAGLELGECTDFQKVGTNVPKA